MVSEKVAEETLLTRDVLSMWIRIARLPTYVEDRRVGEPILPSFEECLPCAEID